MADGTHLAPAASAGAAARPSAADELDALLGDTPDSASSDIGRRTAGYERFMTESVPATHRAVSVPPSRPGSPPSTGPSRPSGGGGGGWLATLALTVLAVIGLALALGRGSDGEADVVVSDDVVVATPAEDDLMVVADDPYLADPADDLMMADTTVIMDGAGMEYRPPASATPSARAERLPSGETRVVAEAGGRTYTFPRMLSRSTSVGTLRHRVLAGRDVVEFEARDGRWATTYYWEYGAGAAHFVASDGSLTNVSRERGTEALLRAALGYVPERTFRTAEERAAERRASAPASSERTGPAYVVLGAYQPYDEAGLDERRRRVAASGRAIRTATSQELGMNPRGLRILYLGPFERATAERIRDEMRAYASDAYLRSVDR